MEEDNEGKIKLGIVYNLDGIMTHIRCRGDKVIREILMAYCDKKQMEYRDISFLYNGKRLLVKKTPFQLGMQDDDVIEAFRHVSGGR